MPAGHDGPIERLPRREPAQQVPQAVPGEPGLVTVDATWGTIQPLHLPGGVKTVAEQDVVAHIQAGGVLVDCRRAEYVAQGTLPGAVPIDHEAIVAGLDELSPQGPVVLFCNGPQCTATPQAVGRLLKAGWDPDRLRYYRGGVHDWMTLGLPLAR